MCFVDIEALGCTASRVVSALSVIFKLASLDDTAMATRLQTPSAALGLRQPRHVITSGSVCVLISSLSTPPGCCRSPAFQTWCSPRRARESVLRPGLASVNHPTSRAQITVSESGPTARSHTCAKARPPPQSENSSFLPRLPHPCLDTAGADHECASRNHQASFGLALLLLPRPRAPLFCVATPYS